MAGYAMTMSERAGWRLVVIATISIVIYSVLTVLAAAVGTGLAIVADTHTDRIFGVYLAVIAPIAWVPTVVPLFAAQAVGRYIMFRSSAKKPVQ
jgi:hypothetical protein